MSRLAAKWGAAPGALAVAVSLLVAGCDFSSERKPASESLEATLSRLAAKHRVCSASATLITARSIARTANVSTCADAPVPTAESLYQAGSLTKPMLAYAVLKLARDEKIDIDAPLLPLLPGGYMHRVLPYQDVPNAEVQRVADPRLTAVTARMAMNHTSGMPGWVESGPFTFLSNPGTRWSYSSEGYVYLQRVVEAVTAEPFAATMAKAVIAPLALRHSTFAGTPGAAGKLVPGRDAAGAKVPLFVFREASAAGTLATTPEDYARFMLAVLGDKPLLEATLAGAIPFDAARGLSWGLGWAIETHGSERFILHWGVAPGYRTFAIASAQSGDGLVLMTDSDNGLALARDLNRAVLGRDQAIFKFHMLKTGLARIVCEKLAMCF